MIEFYANLDLNQIRLKIYRTKAFDSIIQILRKYKCTFDADSPDKSWIIPLSKFQIIKDQLAEVDVIQISESNEQAIHQLQSSIAGQLVITTNKKLFIPNLLKHAPIRGKHPNENYQLDDIIRGINQNRLILDLEMGLGKSYIIIGILAHLKYYGELGKTLILTTRSGTYNFYHEIFYHTSIFSKEKVIIATKDTKTVFEQDYEIIITDFDTFRLISDHYYSNTTGKKGVKYRSTKIPIDSWIGDKPACLVLDESHCIGNAKSRRYQTIKLIANKFYYRYLSSGTFADKFEKLYSQLSVLDPALVNHQSYTDWLLEYANVGNRFSPYAVNYFYKNKMEALLNKVRSQYASYRRLADHLDLPENYVKKIYVKMHPKHEEIYQAFLKNELSSLSDYSVQSIVNRFPYLMISLDNPQLLLKHENKFTEEFIKKIETFKFDYLEKFNVLDSLLEETFEDVDKIILWAIHPSTMNHLAERYKKYSPLMIHGEVPVPRGMNLDGYKRHVVDTFKSNKNHKILIASIPVLNTAVTITEAKAQIYVERNFTYVDYVQSMKRIHRIGQDEHVKTYVLLYDYSLDVYMDNVLESKGVLTEKLLSKSTLTKEEWAKIFKMSSDVSLDFIQL